MAKMIRRLPCTAPDQAVARLGGVPGLQPVGPDPQLQQGVAVEAVVGRAVLVVEFGLGEDRVIFGELLDQPQAQDAQIAHRHAVARVGPAAGIGEGRRGHAERLGAFGHLPGKGLFGARQPLGHHDAGVIARIDDHAVDQVATVGRSVVLQDHGRAAHGHLHLARDETAKVVSIVTRPSRSASNSMLMVISFDIEAGGTGWSAFLSISTVCVVMS
jgi:hypothetical protein